MKRISVVALLALGVGLPACGRRPEPEPPPPPPVEVGPDTAAENAARRARARADSIAAAEAARRAAEEAGRTARETLTAMIFFDYDRAEIRSDMQEAGDDDVLRKVRGDLEAAGVQQSDHQIRRQMDDLMAEAVAQIEAGG